MADPPLTAMKEATAKALAITELVEQVLLNLPALNIIGNTTRVCKAWKQLIDDSQQIQIKVHKRLAPGQEVLSPSRWEQLGVDDELPLYIASQGFDSSLHYQTKSNGSPTMPWIGEASMFEKDILFATAMSESTLGPQSSTATTGSMSPSWRDVFITSPPISTAVIHVRMAGLYWPFIVFASVFCREGIKWGLVEDTAAATLKSMRDVVPTTIGMTATRGVRLLYEDVHWREHRAVVFKD